MFQIGEIVIYGTSGACRINAVEKRELGDCVQECYVLKPVYDNSLTIRVPRNNEMLMAKMHPVITKDEVMDLIHEMPETENCYDADMNARKLFYSDTLKSGDHHSLLKMIKSIYCYKKERMANGKRLSGFDENAMREAENMLYTEFALALDIQPNQVVSFIQNEVSTELQA